MRKVLFTLLVLLPTLKSEDLPIVGGVEPQPFAAQVIRLLDSLDMLVAIRLPNRIRTTFAAGRSGQRVEEIQRILDKHCLVGVNINPESRVKVQEGRPSRSSSSRAGGRSW